MPNPVRMVYEATIKDVVSAYTKRIPLLYQNLSQTPSEEEIGNLLGRYEEVWNDYHQDILTAIGQDISFYLNYYGVMPRGSIDEFKAIYFTGMVLSRFMHREGHSDLRHLIDHTTIYLLDFRLHHKLGATRPTMTAALRKIVEENDTEEHLGKHGMYLLYKCIFNALRATSTDPVEAL